MLPQGRIAELSHFNVIEYDVWLRVVDEESPMDVVHDRHGQEHGGSEHDDAVESGCR